MPSRTVRASVFAILASGLLPAQQIPYHQDRPPNEPLTPQQAIARMVVPDGFRVDLFAAEPELVNPVAMAFDEKGRVYVAESVEYPRQEPGPGRDRIKVFEDTDGDGRADRVTLFADGLNIPSGIAVGHGGVWVANAPDLLLLRDTDGDLKADRREVVLTGFGRSDTHELPNSLTFGPDGWLYGLNGLYNPGVIRHQGKEHRFDGVMFRLHPRSREFELFSEGNSNPWGIAFDQAGQAFVSACVIDHLWHIVDTGYTIRQSGPYPPYTWPIESIVDHFHQKAAYCGLEWLESDTWPAEYQGLLFMGNIHGNCINVDRLERRGSTYRGVEQPDFLSAHDAWFMPVDQVVGPDGDLWVLDWYDRYHCYQDARRDAEGVDRGRGRLYRVHPVDAERRPPVDLGGESDGALIERLADGNVWRRRTAQRLLSERLAGGTAAGDTLTRLEESCRDSRAERRPARGALFTLVAAQRLSVAVQDELTSHTDPTLRAWAIRAVPSSSKRSAVVDQLTRLAADPDPEVRLQVAIQAGKRDDPEMAAILIEVLVHSGDDPLIPRVAWRHLRRRIAEVGVAPLAEQVAALERRDVPGLAAVLARASRFLLGRAELTRAEGGALAGILEVALAHAPEEEAVQTLRLLAERMGTHRAAGAWVRPVQQQLGSPLARIAAVREPLRAEMTLLSASWGDPAALELAEQLFAAADADPDQRAAAFERLVAASGKDALRHAGPILSRPGESAAVQRRVLQALARIGDPEVGELVIGSIAGLDPAARRAAHDLLVQRSAWRRALVDAVAAGRLPASSLDAHQIRALQSDGDPRTSGPARRLWSVLGDSREDRALVIHRVKSLLRRRAGDPEQGRSVFLRICSPCHQFHGEGTLLGPELTGNGRGSLDQLLSNVLDPNLVVGASWQLRTVELEDGRVLSGTERERDEHRLVLAQASGGSESVAIDAIVRESVLPISLMPEGLESTMSEQELVDLFDYLTIDGDPRQGATRRIPGAGRIEPEETSDPARFPPLVDAVAPGFTTEASGVAGVELLEEHLGRDWVVRTHPVDRATGCVLFRTLTLPPGDDIRLVLEAGRHDLEARQDWLLLIRIDGEVVLEQAVDARTAPTGWCDIDVDLSRFAGRAVRIELVNAPTGWYFEFGFFREVRLLVDGVRW